jgi:hypothetical protein
MKLGIFVVVAISCLAISCLAGSSAVAQPAPPTPAPERAPEEHLFQPPPGDKNRAEVVMGTVDPRTTASEPKTIQVTGSLPGNRSSVDAGALKNLQPVNLRDGEAQVRLDGVVRTVREGDALGTDVVRSVESNRLVLARSEGSGRESTVIVTFDAQGTSRVRVYSTQDSKPLIAPPAK